jgi:hypothetical protein
VTRNATTDDFAPEGQLPTLPEGKTCGDCEKIEWCEGMFARGRQHTDCMWKPDAPIGFKLKEIPSKEPFYAADADYDEN